MITLFTITRDATAMNLKILGAFAAVALLAACSTPTPAPTASAASGASVTAGPVPGSQEDLVANVGDRIFFDFDKSSVTRGKGSLTQNNQATLDKQAAWLAKYAQNAVQVAGNCDDRGTEEYNIALGQRRANADRDYMVAKGVAAARITTISYGKDRPVAMGDNEAAWAQNRNAITSVK
jgi:peptidoglycan-associated lipoprotein